MFTRFLLAASLLLLVASSGPLGAEAPAGLPADTRAVVHSLNRLAFGPRPGDVERVQAMGLHTWIEQQLASSRTSDPAVDARLARLTTLMLDPQTLAREYHVPAQLERRRIQSGVGSRESGVESSAEPRVDGAMAAPPDSRLPTPDSRPPAPGSRPPNDVLRKDQQIITDLSEAKLLRAVYSDRQLEEVLVDFWFNHFNVFAGKGPERVWVGAYEREAIRPYVLGNFRQMLEAVAKSEAMLFYLDNWQSGVAGTGTGSREPGTGSRRPGSQAPTGPQESKGTICASGPRASTKTTRAS